MRGLLMLIQDLAMDAIRKIRTFILLVMIICSSYVCKEKIPAVIPEYEAVAGGEARLPCNYTLPNDPELVALILWYRDQSTAPFYTLDFRKGTKNNPKHFPTPSYAERAHFDVNVTPPTVKLNPVHVEDEGHYRCHVEFRRLRTVTRYIKLNILIPPHSLVIMDDRGQRLKSIAGPYDEGAYLSLLCEAEGGKPSPTVTWWRERALLDDTYYRASQGFVRNELVILELRRSDLMVELICQASNTNLTHPTNESVRIDLNLRPLYSRITTLQRPLKAGDDLRLNCESSGSRPPAKISWWLENRRIQSGKESIPKSRNVTYSSLNLSPGIEDNGKMITCKAENKLLAHPPVQDSWYLNIHFPPIVSLHLGANIKYSTIKEGNDVYMECVIQANPPVMELTWLFDGKPFYTNTSAGIIISNQSLVLQKVKKEHRGRYRCIASNTEGEGQSSDLYLEVRYTPTCKPSQKTMYGVARGETVNITCEVESDPTDVTFRWALNNSVENLELQNYRSRGPTSVVSFTPKTMLEYGAMLCWGRNSVGEQKEPCVVRIIPAGPPDPVRNCVVINQTHTWLLIDCEAGYSGGLTQKFHLDVYNSAVEHLQVNMTSNDTPLFSVHNLPPGTPFVLVVYASNEKGKSNSLAIVGNTLATPDLTADGAFMARLSPLVAILLAVLGTLLMIGVVGLAFVQIRKRRPHKASIEEDKIKMEVIMKKTPDDNAETTTACPDVVPPNNAYASPDCDSISDATKDSDSVRNKENYRNCVVALKRSWSLKKGFQEKTEVEVTLPDLNHVASKQSEGLPLGDLTIEENSTPRKIIIKVENPPDLDTGQKAQVGQAYRTDSV